MGRTVRELLLTMDSRELTEWQLYYEMDPWGGERGDYHAAQVTSAILNVNRGKHPPIRLSDCILKFGQDRPTQSLSQMKQAAKEAAMSRGKRIKFRKKK